VSDRETAVSDHDRYYIEHAVREAKRRNPNRPLAVYDFVRDVLLKRADYIPEHERDELLRFVGKFQQLTSPVTAKGVEDTALYIYNRLVSLNEVGSEPDRFGTAPDELHRFLRQRSERWPHGLSTTSTHDTKRSEDVRARINVLSELPGAWKQATGHWARVNRRGRTNIEGQSYPSRNEEFLLYQTLVGSWPLEPLTDDVVAAYRERIVAYMHKAMREAKVFTSWLNPSPVHEDAMSRFISTVLAPDNVAFRESFLPFQARVARYGIYNSLAQVAIKVGAPGVPDFYQGSELWDLSLVDPDNRRPVDYDRRRMLLADLDRRVCANGKLAVANELAAAPQDDRMKLYATSAMLRLRRARRETFDDGRYEPVAADGARREHVFAFARIREGHHVVVVVPRLVATLTPDAAVPPLGERVWGDTRLLLPDGAERLQDVFTDAGLTAERRDGRLTLPVAEVLSRFPIAVIESESR
jgi:(1->4)-alpha-D-glucan 1-alpha-D-glucosylmutase